MEVIYTKSHTAVHALTTGVGGTQYAANFAFCRRPETAPAEMVFHLSRREIRSKKIHVDFSLEDMDTSGFQEGATYEQIKAYVLEHSGLKISRLYIAQVKRKYGIIETENYNNPKSDDSLQRQCPPEKAAAIRAALAYYGMIG